LARAIPDDERCSMLSRFWAPSFGLGLAVCFGTRSRVISFGWRDQQYWA
jgi:hypothetical protein